jgi:hypothetical protein
MLHLLHDAVSVSDDGGNGPVWLVEVFGYQEFIIGTNENGKKYKDTHMT